MTEKQPRHVQFFSCHQIESCFTTGNGWKKSKRGRPYILEIHWLCLLILLDIRKFIDIEFSLGSHLPAGYFKKSGKSYLRFFQFLCLNFGENEKKTYFWPKKSVFGPFIAKNLKIWHQNLSYLRLFQFHYLWRRSRKIVFLVKICHFWPKSQFKPIFSWNHESFFGYEWLKNQCFGKKMTNFDHKIHFFTRTAHFFISKPFFYSPPNLGIVNEKNLR